MYMSHLLHHSYVLICLSKMDDPVSTQERSLLNEFVILIINCVYSSHLSACLDVLLDGSVESRGVGSHDGGDLLAVLVESKGGHGGDANLLGNGRGLVNVTSVERSLGERLGELVKGGGNHLAGSAPGGVEVDDGELLRLDSGLELREGSKLLDGHFVWCGVEKSGVTRKDLNTGSDDSLHLYEAKEGDRSSVVP